MAILLSGQLPSGGLPVDAPTPLFLGYAVVSVMRV